jgi:hypothetical protein
MPLYVLPFGGMQKREFLLLPQDIHITQLTTLKNEMDILYFISPYLKSNFLQ